jgi:hypothetical protein
MNKNFSITLYLGGILSYNITKIIKDYFQYKKILNLL